LTLGGVTYAATGTGQSLIGAIGTPAEGLTLKFTGLPAQVLPGEEGIVSLSDGHASRLATQMDKALGTGGLVAAKTDGLNASIKDIGTRRDVLNTRLDRVEKQLRAQYVALDSLLSRMNTTSSFLTQQLASTTSSK
jgi:flagellar hook-associated protein 2